MKYFFEDEARVKLLCAEAERWLGTPFFYRGKIKGAGVDCGNLVQALMVAAGVTDHWEEVPNYGVDFSYFKNISVGLNFMRGNEHVKRLLEEITLPEQVTEEEKKFGLSNAFIKKLVMPGDIIMFKTGLSANHTAVVLRGTTFVHVWAQMTCSYGELYDTTFKKRLSNLFRPLAL